MKGQWFNTVLCGQFAANLGTKYVKKGESAEKLSDTVVQGILAAINNGYTHIDGAEGYGTEPDIAEAVRLSGKPRSDFFITTKVYKNASDTKAALEKSLSNLNTDYVDLYLIHAPFITKETHGKELEQVWQELEDYYHQGKVKAIGVSNFRVEDLEKILKIAKVKPSVHQIEYNPYLLNQTPGIVKFSQDNGILVEAYAPLGPLSAPDGGPLKPVLEQLSTKYSKTKAQILLRWTYQTNVLPITLSSDYTRQKEALNIFDFELTADEVANITDIGSTFTFRKFWAKDFSKYDTN